MNAKFIINTVNKVLIYAVSFWSVNISGKKQTLYTLIC